MIVNPLIQRLDKSFSSFNKKKAVGISLFILLAGCVPSKNMLGMEQAVLTLSANSKIFVQFLRLMAWMIGMVLMTRSILKLKIYGEMRSMMSPHAKLGQIFTLLLVGTALMYLPTTLNVASNAILGVSTVDDMLSYQGSQDDTSASYTQAIRATQVLLQFVGYISFIRGLLQLTSSQEGGGRHTFGQAITHIIAGILAVNIQTVSSLLGY